MVRRLAMIICCVFLCSFEATQARSNSQKQPPAASQNALKIAFTAFEWTRIPVQEVEGRAQPDFLAAIGFGTVAGALFCTLSAKTVLALSIRTEAAAAPGDYFSLVCAAGTLYQTTAKPQDKAAALKILRQAADASYCPAIFNLAVLGEAKIPQSTPQEIERLFTTAARCVDDSQTSKMSAAAGRLCWAEGIISARVWNAAFETYVRWNVALSSGLLPPTRAVSELEKSMTPDQIAEAKLLLSRGISVD